MKQEADALNQRIAYSGDYTASTGETKPENWCGTVAPSTLNEVISEVQCKICGQSDCNCDCSELRDEANINISFVD